MEKISNRDFSLSGQNSFHLTFRDKVGYICYYAFSMLVRYYPEKWGITIEK